MGLPLAAAWESRPSGPFAVDSRFWAVAIAGHWRRTACCRWRRRAGASMASTLIGLRRFRPAGPPPRQSASGARPGWQAFSRRGGAGTGLCWWAISLGQPLVALQLRRVSSRLGGRAVAAATLPDPTLAASPCGRRPPWRRRLQRLWYPALPAVAAGELLVPAERPHSLLDLGIQSLSHLP